MIDLILAILLTPIMLIALGVAHGSLCGKLTIGNHAASFIERVIVFLISMAVFIFAAMPVVIF